MVGVTSLGFGHAAAPKQARQAAQKSPRRIDSPIPRVAAEAHGPELGTQLCEHRIELARATRRRGDVEISSAFRKHGRKAFARLDDALEKNDVARAQENAPHDHSLADARYHGPPPDHFAQRTPALLLSHPLNPAALHEYDRVLPA